MKQKDDIATKTFVQSALDSAIDKLREDLTEQIKQLKDEILTRLDKILGFSLEKKFLQ